VHNAGTLGPVPLRLMLDTDCEDVEHALAVHVLGPLRLTKAVAGSMLVRGAGTVLAITSDAAVEAYPRWGAYGLSKAALEHMMRTLAVELAPVRFNAIHPGIISDTPAWADKKEAIANIEKRTPGGRLATTEDVVHAVDFLFVNRGVNGINLVIDGGWLLT